MDTRKCYNQITLCIIKINIYTYTKSIEHILFWVPWGGLLSHHFANLTVRKNLISSRWMFRAVTHGLYQSWNWGKVILHRGLSPVLMPSRLVLEDPPAVSPWTRVTHNGPHRTMPLWPRSTGAGKASRHEPHKTPGAFQLPKNTDRETVRQIDVLRKTWVYQMTLVNRARRMVHQEARM